MKDNRIMIAVVLAVLVIFGITAFVVLGGNKADPDDFTNTNVMEEVTKDTVKTEEPKDVENESIDQPAETSVPVVDQVALPTVRTGLESTNPGSVTLASGELQLIEFFAFW